MKRSAFCFAALMTLSVFAVPAVGQTHSGVDMPYILNSSEGIADDFSRWAPGVDVGKSKYVLRVFAFVRWVARGRMTWGLQAVPDDNWVNFDC